MTASLDSPTRVHLVVRLAPRSDALHRLLTVASRRHVVVHALRFEQQVDQDEAAIVLGCDTTRVANVIDSIRREPLVLHVEHRATAGQGPDPRPRS